MPTARRTQADRRAQTRAQLLDAARVLATEAGFSEASTPDLVARAGVTRGALYHHFKDKTDLFRAMAAREAAAVGAEIAAATQTSTDPARAMLDGTEAYFDAMAHPGRARILLVDAPAILGPAEALALTRANGSAELREGLDAALPEVAAEERAALTETLSAAFDRAALAIASGADRAPFVAALMRLMQVMTEGAGEAGGATSPPSPPPPR